MKVEKWQLIEVVDQLLARTPEHALICPPLQRGLLVRIVEELRNVSRETNLTVAITQPEGVDNE